MILIPGARFWMGSREDEPLAQDDERPLRKVEIWSFRMSRCPVTQRLYREVMGTNPSRPEGNDLPVNRVSWTDAVEFCNRLSKLKGLAPAYRIEKDKVAWLREANGYRLPTEAEWEHAARGIDERIYPWGNEPPSAQLCWSGARLSKVLHRRHGPSPVGSYPKGASAFGLLDMAGNVWEWCWDCYGSYTPTDLLVIDPVGPSAGKTRVLRGGSWKTGAATRLRAAARGKFVASLSSEDVGFRCARGGKHETRSSPAQVPRPKR
jgi:formylglycine-generating enzyme required for sulfatase activity